MPAFTKEQHKRLSSMSLLFIVVPLINAAGIVLLFFKSELDLQQLRTEIGLVRREGDVGYVTQRECSTDIADLTRLDASTSQAVIEQSRIMTTGLGYVVMGSSQCQANYELGEAQRITDPDSGDYIGIEQDLKIGGSSAGQILSQTPVSYKMHPSPYPKMAFRNEKLVVTYSMRKNLNFYDLPGCTIFIAQEP
jgi:hypothetical protein